MTGPRWRGAVVVAAALGLWTPLALSAGLDVGSGSSFDLGSARLDLGCGDLGVSGSFAGGAGTVDQARDVTIGVGGTLQGEAGTFRVAGDWSNSGSFDAGTGTVAFVDGCGRTSATISGDSSFFDLEMVTSTAKLYAFAAGSTTAVTDFLTISGSPGNRLQIRSSVDGSAAFLDLQGGQSVSFVDVRDNHAISIPIDAGPGSISSGNTPGWTFLAAVPALTLLGGALLALAMLWSGRRALAARSPVDRADI